MPGIAVTSSSAVSRPPVRLEMVPPVATRRTRGASVAGCGAGTACAEAVRATSSAITAAARTRDCAEMCTRRRPAGRLSGRRVRLTMERIQVPVQERPHAIPRIALLARVLRQPRLRIDAAVEGVAARRIVVDRRLGELRLARAQRVDELHVLLEVHVLVVARHADVERNLQLVDVVERRSLLVDLVPL